MSKQGHKALLTTDFPLYSVACFGGQQFLAGGGGGAAKTGIPNAIETFEITHIDSHRCEIEGLNRTLTDDLVEDANEAIMNGAVSNWGLKARSVFYATGMNNHCTIFEVYKEPNKVARYVRSLKVCEASEGYQTSVGWAHDNSWIAAADSSGHVTLWSFPEMEKKFRFSVHKSEIEWMVISPISFTVRKNNVLLTFQKFSFCETVINVKMDANFGFSSSGNKISRIRKRECKDQPIMFEKFV